MTMIQYHNMRATAVDDYHILFEDMKTGQAKTVAISYHPHEWAWKAQKTQIKTSYETAAALLAQWTDDKPFRMYFRNIAEYYTGGVFDYTFTAEDAADQEPQEEREAAESGSTDENAAEMTAAEAASEPVVSERIEIRLARLKGVTVEVHGAKTASPVLWVFGETKAHMTELKAAGLRWSPKKRGWWMKYPAA